MRLLLGLRHHVAAGHGDEAAVVAGERLLDHHARDGIESLLPLGVFEIPIDEEAAQLHLRARFARAEFDAPAGNQIERGDPFGDAGRVIEVRRKLNDAVAQADAFGALAGGGQEDLGRAGMRVLLQEVMFHFPDEIETQSIGQFHLIERIEEQLFLGALRPGPGHLVFVEKAEAHLAGLRFVTRQRRGGCKIGRAFHRVDCTPWATAGRLRSARYYAKR